MGQNTSKEFDAYLRTERGVAPKSIIRHLPVVRRFLHEVSPAGDDDLSKISQEDVIRYVERHAQDWSPRTGKAMCWSLRAFLRCLHHRGLNPRALAGCVPSMRRWKLATLPNYLSASQVQKALDGCDRATAMGRRDYAILMMLAKLGLRANEVATLTLDDIDWRAGEMLVRAKGRTGCAPAATDTEPARRCVLSPRPRRPPRPGRRAAAWRRADGGRRTRRAAGSNSNRNRSSLVSG